MDGTPVLEKGRLIIIVIIIACKGAIRDFVQYPHCAANRLRHVRSSGPGAILCKSRATSSAYHVQLVLRATWYEGTAQLLNLAVKIAFILALLYWLNH